MNIIVGDSRNKSILEKTNDSIKTDILNTTHNSTKGLPKHKKKNNLASWEFTANNDNPSELWCSSPQESTLRTINNTNNTPSPPRKESIGNLNVNAIDLLKMN